MNETSGVVRGATGSIAAAQAEEIVKQRKLIRALLDENERLREANDNLMGEIKALEEKP